MALARPYFKLVGDPELIRSGEASYSEGYDGAAWEWFADPGLVIRTVGAPSAASRHGAYVEGTLVDYRVKGATAQLGECVPIGDQPAWQVTVTARDGFRRDYFIDKETWLVIAERMSAPVHAYGEPVSRETRVGDYRRVGGVLFAHRYSETNIATGEMVSEMQWRKIEVNRDLPSAWFAPPDFERTPFQAFLEQLFWQRTDDEAVMWTYAEFRRVHPEIDTSAGTALIGFQMEKMGDHRTAVRLLEANATDYPDSASAAFSLGRAYAAAGDKVAARRELERALSLDAEHRGARKTLESLE